MDTETGQPTIEGLATLQYPVLVVTVVADTELNELRASERGWGTEDNLSQTSLGFDDRDRVRSELNRRNVNDIVSQVEC
jgi:hypothetical protein